MQNLLFIFVFFMIPFFHYSVLTRPRKFVQLSGKTPWDYNGPRDSVNEATVKGYTMGNEVTDKTYKEGDYNGAFYSEKKTVTVSVIVIGPSPTPELFGL